MDEDTLTVATDNSDVPLIHIGPHEFKMKYLKKPTWCGICHEFIIGVTQAQQNAFKCVHCKLVGHQHCLTNSTKNECAKKKVEFSDVTDEAMKKFLGNSAQKAGQVFLSLSPSIFFGVDR
jgi:hypothetical protein